MTTAAPLPSRDVRPGIWCQLGDAVATRIAARSGAAWVCLDAQHGLFDRAAIAATLAARDDDWAPVAIRTTAVDAAEIGYALDAGADWVIVPLVETVEQVRRAVAAAYYPPLGRRSWGPLTPVWDRPAPDPAAANAAGRLWIMIETAEGLDALDELFAVPGVSGVLVGPNDLALSLGLDQDAMLADTRPEAPVQRILAAATRAGIVAAAFGGTPERGARLLAQGYGYVIVGTDAAALATGVRGLLAQSRAEAR
ncbi:aldolase/citrate lyase family protein [Pseudolysinimonas kribbensis]|uniref:Aldolase n=1 Tax=Pseudolysinimonas kribbensis TaxID=433641 RepID=A0ABQ6K258_9MICO|nr:aldolase/citrate lyase family protein [Pseudolysinimonas kribbensis]GMA94012.1 aldolase [Pseudolysinimonas kribbensis]